MMRLIGLGTLAVVSFILTLLLPIALSGNLSKEGLTKLFTKTPPPEQSVVEKEDPLDPFVRALKEREEALNKREEALKTQEEQIKKSQADLDQLRKAVEAQQTDINEKVKQADADQQKRMKMVADSLAKMKPGVAADSIKELTPEEAAQLLMLMKDKERAKILNQFTTQAAAAGETPAKTPTPVGQPTEAQKASEILRRMQEKKL